MSQPLTQRSFLKGLDTSTSKLDQPRGSLPAISNMVFTKRGSLITADGVRVIGDPADLANLAPLPTANQGQIVDIIQYLNPSAGATLNGAVFYLQDSPPGYTLSDPGPLVAASIVSAGGTLIPATNYSYVVLTLDNGLDVNFHSPGALGVTGIVLGGGKNAVQLTWPVVAGAGGYAVYGRILGLLGLLAIVLQPDFQQNSAGPIGAPTATFTDNGTVMPGIAPVFTQTTRGALILWKLGPDNAGGYNSPIPLAIFPRRGPATTGTNSTYPNACGGLIGSSQAVPMMVQFAGFVAIALGNGVRPQYTDGTTVFPFTNTFTSLYVTWTASTTYLVGDIVKPLTPNGHIFIVTQAGQTAAAEPAWNTGTSQVTVDNQIVWKENGQLTSSPAPPGAAHLISHAGSLWAFNTSPTNTSDGLNGPSSLLMSDSNNIKSWNPLNQAFIGKDDGSQGMGLASFTIAEAGIAPLGSLVIFKDFSTYQLVGVFGSPNLTIQQIQSDMGCIAPRSIKFLPGFGIARMSHLGVTMFDGIRDKVISEQIRPLLFPVTLSPAAIVPNQSYLMKSGQFASPPMYGLATNTIGGLDLLGLNKIFLYDLILKAWTIIDLPVPISGLPTQTISSIYQMRQPGGTPQTIIGGNNNGSILVMQSGATRWNYAAITPSVSWSFTTPEVFNTSDPSAEIYTSSMIIRGSNIDGQPITVTLNIQTEAGTIQDNRVYNIGAGEFEQFIGIHEQAISFNAIISGIGRVEVESVTWNVQPKTSGIPAVLT